jgi:hypothetical protein
MSSIFAGSLAGISASLLLPFFSAFADSTVFVPTGATWKYLDDGSNQGTAWTQPAFSDSAWASGCAPLGYGDNNECTVVSFGSDPQQKHITTYFRREFLVTNAAQYVALSAQVMRDDGAVVYLNGAEVWRSNMPGGPILYRTSASRFADEDTFVPATFCASGLAEGTNVLAVEIHQVAANSSDIRFDLRLEGLTVLTPDVRLTTPSPSAKFSLGSPIQIAADATEPCGAIRVVEFYANGVKIGEATGEPFQFTWNDAPLGNVALEAVAWNEFGTRGSFGPVWVSVLAAENTSLVAKGSIWKYLDDGSNQGSAWTASGFNDAAWNQGPAELGYGDAEEGRPEATVVSYGPDPANKFITTYFRQPFVVSNASLFPNLILRVLRDDGVVVYLNGTEIFRNLMPPGPIDYLMPASASVGLAEETNWVQTCLTPNLLVDGTNLLAAEIHQAFPESSDISFDLELVTGPAAPPQLTVTALGSAAVICWPRWSDCHVLETTDRLTATSVWQPVTAPVDRSGTQNCVSVPISQSTAFFRLKLQ